MTTYCHARAFGNRRLHARALLETVVQRARALVRAHDLRARVRALSESEAASFVFFAALILTTFIV